MKISMRRLEEALNLRDVALSILNSRIQRTGPVPDELAQYNTRSMAVESLTILHGQPLSPNEDLLDVWDGRKVFSIAWNVDGEVRVVAFRPGTWQARLLAAVA
jgi:hypothetical protein